MHQAFTVSSFITFTCQFQFSASLRKAPHWAIRRFAMFLTLAVVAASGFSVLFFFASARTSAYEDSACWFISASLMSMT